MRGGPAAPMAADKPGVMSSGAVHTAPFDGEVILIRVLQARRERSTLNDSLRGTLRGIDWSLRYRFCFGCAVVTMIDFRTSHFVLQFVSDLNVYLDAHSNVNKEKIDLHQ